MIINMVLLLHNLHRVKPVCLSCSLITGYSADIDMSSLLLSVILKHRLFVFIPFEVIVHQFLMRSSDLMDNMSASQPRDHGFEPHTGHDHDS